MLEVEDHHLATSDASDTMNFWSNRVNIYDKLSLIVQDIIAAPGVRWKGILCAACLLLVAETEWPIKSLQMRACLKLNKKVLANTDINISVWTFEL